MKLIGFYIYFNGENEDKIILELNVEINKGIIEGVGNDNITNEYFKTPFRVNGFIQSDHMNFIIKYPHSFYYDEENKIILDSSLEHPDIIHNAFYNSESNKWIGEWEMLVEEDVNFWGTGEQFHEHGYFELSND